MTNGGVGNLLASPLQLASQRVVSHGAPLQAVLKAFLPSSTAPPQLLLGRQQAFFVEVDACLGGPVEAEKQSVCFLR